MKLPSLRAIAVECSRVGAPALSERLSVFSDRQKLLSAALRPFAHRRSDSSVIEDWKEDQTEAGDRSLCGVVMCVADTVNSRRLPTELGDREMYSVVPDDDAAVIATLREAGAAVAAKSVVPSMGGRTPPEPAQLCPTNFSRHVTHGAGVAVGAGLCDVAVGTECEGEVTRTAAQCGVAAWRTSHGSLPTAGCLLATDRSDTVSFCARTVADLRHLSGCFSLPDPPPKPADRGFVRVGVVRQWGAYGELPQAELDASVSALSRIPASEVRCVDIKHPLFVDTQLLVAEHHRMVARDRADAHDEWFGNELWDREYKRGMAAHMRGALRMGREVFEAYEFQKRWRHFVEKLVLEAWGLDALLCPTADLPAQTHRPAPEEGPMELSERTTVPWCFSGHPGVVVPLGLLHSSGQPLAVQVVGRRQADQDLLRLCERFELVFREAASEAGNSYPPAHDVDPLDLLQRGSQYVERQEPEPEKKKRRSFADGCEYV
eukprot:TRINITY_DN30303_c0_g1_i1.p1 TRINITY_DN30303_c0_g1~~TRINITY_DN30303_c0_g1_i1.p1  ORF type:complete len:489 (+),score=164.31 TRINITY_DN30303_c0_g1_i1:112-1578(+)